MENDNTFKHLKNPSHYWYIYSGATTHMSNKKQNFSSFQVIHPVRVELGNGLCIQAVGKGTVKMHLQADGRSSVCLFQDVLYISDLGFQPIYVPVMDRRGYVSQFGNRKALIKHKQEIIANGSLTSTNLYVLDTTHPVNHPQKALTASLKTSHYRLRHVNPDGIRKMILDNVVEGA